MIKENQHIEFKSGFSDEVIAPGIWRELNNFSSGAICLVLASEKYDETDYIRDYKEFLESRDVDMLTNVEGGGNVLIFIELASMKCRKEAA